MSEELLIKVKKLHLKALSAQKLGNVEEAETFLAKVSEICFKNNITIKSVEDVDFEGSNRVKTSIEDHKDHFTYGSKKQEGVQWEPDLLNYLAKYNFCLIVFSTWKRKASIIGRIENVELVSFLFDITRDILRRESSKTYETQLKAVRENHAVIAVTAEEASFIRYHAEMIPSTWKESILNHSEQYWYMKNPELFGFISSRSIFIRSFLMGAAVGIGRKLKESREIIVNISKNSEQIAGLVKVEDQSLKEAQAKFYKKLNHIKGEAPGNASAWYHGIDFGGSINLPSGGIETTIGNKSLK